MMLDYTKKIYLYTDKIYITFDFQNRIIDVFYENNFHYTYFYQSNSQRTRRDCYHNSYRLEYFNSRSLETAATIDNVK